MMKLTVLMGATLAGLSILSTAAEAQTTSNTVSSNASSGTNWGTTSSSTSANSTTDSAAMHNQNGLSAGQVNATRQGILLNVAPGVSITAIGSQNIVSTTILGDNNSTNVNASQSSSNSGTVSTNGTIARQ